MAYLQIANAIASWRYLKTCHNGAHRTQKSLIWASANAHTFEAGEHHVINIAAAWAVHTVIAYPDLLGMTSSGNRK